MPSLHQPLLRCKRVGLHYIDSGRIALETIQLTRLAKATFPILRLFVTNFG
jgi:hypothetical protein